MLNYILPPWIDWIWIGAGIFWVTVIIIATHIDRKKRERKGVR